MNKKAFTLIELLAALALLAIVSIITTGVVVSFFKKGKEELYQVQLKNIRLAAKAWASDHRDEIGDCYTLTLNGLQKKGYLDNGIIDVRTNKKIDGKKIFIEIINKQNSFQYYIEENKRTLCKSQYNNDDRVFTVGDKISIFDIDYRIISVYDDYLTLLKEEPLTVDEVEEYGSKYINLYSDISHKAYNQNGYGGISFFSNSTCNASTDMNLDSGYYRYDNCSNKYDESNIKKVVDSWAQNSFIEGELKEVDGYKARLINLDELIKFGYSEPQDCCNGCGYCEWIANHPYYNPSIPNWIYNSDYDYWTMIENIGIEKEVYSVKTDGGASAFPVAHMYSTVRPIININITSIPD